jgi:hypothetical protein
MWTKIVGCFELILELYFNKVKLDVVAHACNPRTQGKKVRGLRVQG